MTLLIISPDYASHLLPLATLGTAWRDAGERVVVATGSATHAIVDSFGFERVDLRLGRGSNPGVIRAELQPTGEDDALRGFFAATRRGMVEALEFQATARLSDLLWQPVPVARAVQAVVSTLQPDSIIVDHLAFSARLALIASGVAYADVVLGHPSALPVVDEVYGYPLAWPAAFRPRSAELARLRRLCERVSAAFTAEWNAALGELAPHAPPSTNAFAERGETLMLNYPAELSPSERTSALQPATFLGSAVRDEPVDAEVEKWLEVDDAPFVYLSFGSFLSERADVLARVCMAIRMLGVRAAVARGSADPDELGELPPSWLVREVLPQVTLLRRSAVTVTHGGNNSVTEALTFGVPLLVLPFSTDQFAGAAAIEDSGFGEALDPNAVTVAELRAALGRLLGLAGAARTSLDALAASLRQNPGKVLARAAL